MKFGLLKNILVAGLIGASFTAATAHADDLLDQVKQRGTLRIGLEGTFPPFDSKAPSGELVGFDVDIAKAVAAKLGVKPEFVTTEWSGIIAGLQAGKFDVIVNQVGITDARKQVLDFSPGYTFSAAQLIQRKDDTRQFKSLDDLKGKKLGVGLGTNYMDMAKSVPGIDVKTYPGAPEYLADLAAGRLDGRHRHAVGHSVQEGQSEVRQGDRRRDDPARSGRHLREDLGQVVRHRRDQARHELIHRRNGSKQLKDPARDTRRHPGDAAFFFSGSPTRPVLVSARIHPGATTRL
jgi:cystine transport system substrate-binding protein